MAKPTVYNAAARQRINRAVIRSEARADGDAPAGPPKGGGRLPRTYRHFTLTEQLNAGGSAEVEWDDGTTGEVVDPDTCCWGLEGETGEAAAFPNDTGDGVEWRVTKNPGQAVYEGTLDGDATTTGNTNVSVSIGGNTRTVSAYMPAAPGSGKKWAQGSTVFVGHSRGAWKIVSITACPVDA